MLGPYRDVMATPGAKSFSLAGFVARLPISMVTLGIVLLVAGETGSYGLAGAVSASYILASAIASPMLARLLDTLGQDRVLVPSCLVFAAGVGWLVLAVAERWPTPLVHVGSVVAGVSYPPIGACVRARWAKVLGPGPRLNTAYAFEAVVDESIFIVGPAVVTILATQVSPRAGLSAVVVCAVVGGWWLASQRSTQPTPSAGVGRSRDARLPWAWLFGMMLTMACLGSLFGACEVVTVAFADEHGRPEATAVLLGLWAAGSLIAGLITGAITWRQSTRTRYRWGAVAMGAVMQPLPFVDNLVVLGVVLFFAGFAISPTLVAAMSLVEENVPAERLTEGSTWLFTGLAVGLAPGAAIAGHVIDVSGASAAYWVPAVSGLLAAVVAQLPGARGRDPRTQAGAGVVSA